MKILLRLVPSFAFAPALAWAVYAPIPEQEQGKALTFMLGTSAYHDSNIFGGATGDIGSMVYNLTGSVAYNGSVTEQTFASASYQVSNDYEVDRPGSKNLTSHSLDARLAHKISDATDVDVSASYAISRNPQSLLAGVPLNTDQSCNTGELDARFTTTAGPKTGVVAKYRLINLSYDNAALADDLDRTENLLGLEMNYAFLPETKIVGEYRFQDIAYKSDPALKDKTSNFLMTGLDYSAGKNTVLSARVGAEDRRRDSAAQTTVPYAEATARYTYSEGSFLSAGYTHSIEEPSDVVRFTDSQVNRFFLNLQHRLSGTFTASGSVNYEPSLLLGRGAQPDLHETTTRFGVGLSWLPTKNWTVAATFDLDRVNSDDVNRGQARNRYGLSARYTF